MVHSRKMISLVMVASIVTVLGGCRGGISKKPPVHLVLDMDFQQKLKAQSESTFPGWSDKRGMRMPVEGTVARGAFLDDVDHVFSQFDSNGDGKLDRVEANQTKFGTMFVFADTSGRGGESTDQHDGFVDKDEANAFAKLFTYKNSDDTFAAENPLPLDEVVLRRGRQRYNIHCAVCHGLSGTGGVVSKRWPLEAFPDLVQDKNPETRQRLITLPPGELFSAMTEGKNTMPSYASQISVWDRWAIAHYVKALQYHFNN